MARNWKHGNPYSGVTLALPVAAASQVGDIVPVGSDGLTGYMVTPRATSATVAAGTSAPGLVDGQASVRLVGVEFVIEVDITGAVSIGDAVFTDGEGAYGAAGAVFAGYALTAVEDDFGLLAVTAAAPTGS